MEHSDPHLALTFDRMHNNSHGLGGKHLWPLLSTYIERLGCNIMALVDKQYEYLILIIQLSLHFIFRAAQLPQWCDLHHFDKILNVHFTDASKFEDIVKVFIYI